MSVDCARLPGGTSIPAPYPPHIRPATSSIRFENPHSLSYHPKTRSMPAAVTLASGCAITILSAPRQHVGGHHHTVGRPDHATHALKHHIHCRRARHPFSTGNDPDPAKLPKRQTAAHPNPITTRLPRPVKISAEQKPGQSMTSSSDQGSIPVHPLRPRVNLLTCTQLPFQRSRPPKSINRIPVRVKQP